MTISVLIVDDEIWSREAIRLRLSGHSGFEVIGEADNGEDALLLMRSLSPDLVFLDIEMPALSGIEVAQDAKPWFKGTTVFVTAFSHYAVSAFEVEAFNYLVKPINDKKFEELLTRLLSVRELGASIDPQNEFSLTEIRELHKNNAQKAEAKRNSHLQRISLKDGLDIKIVNVDDIQYIESAGDYLGVTTEQGTLIQRMTMKQILTLLDPNQFIRCHRSHIINRRFIDSFSASDNQALITTLDGREHLVSRRFLSAVRQFLSPPTKCNKG